MTPVFGPGWGNYAIAGLVETQIPPAVSMLPSTPGWWLLGIGLIVWRLYKILSRWRTYQANRYRRAALEALEQLQQRCYRGDHIALRELAPLLRATAIEASGDRQQVASIRGDEWTRLLAEMAPGVPALPYADLEVLAYAPLEKSLPSNCAELFASLREWLEQHELNRA